MTRKSAPAPEEAPVEEPATAPPVPDIRDQLEAEFKARTAARQSRTVTIQQLYGELVALVASSTGKRFRDGIPTVTEQTGVKILELALGWALNARNGSVNPILDDDAENGETQEEEADLLPTPDEIIEAAPDSADEE